MQIFVIIVHCLQTKDKKMMVKFQNWFVLEMFWCWLLKSISVQINKKSQLYCDFKLCVRLGRVLVKIYTSLGAIPRTIKSLCVSLYFEHCSEAHLPYIHKTHSHIYVYNLFVCICTYMYANIVYICWDPWIWTYKIGKAYYFILYFSLQYRD